MKTLSAMAAAKVVAAIAAFFLGFAWALPWDRLAEHALLEASLQGDKAGVQVSYGSARKISALPPRVEILDLAVGSLLGVLKAPSVNLAIRPMALDIESSAATLGMAGMDPLILGRMQAEVSRSGQLVRLDSLLVEGAFSVSGWGTWSTAERRLTAADLVLKAPAGLSPGLNLLALSTPLKPSGEGQWRLRIP
jgi:hypothetical protein